MGRGSIKEEREVQKLSACSPAVFQGVQHVSVVVLASV